MATISKKENRCMSSALHWIAFVDMTCAIFIEKHVWCNQIFTCLSRFSLFGMWQNISKNKKGTIKMKRMCVFVRVKKINWEIERESLRESLRESTFPWYFIQHTWSLEFVSGSNLWAVLLKPWGRQVLTDNQRHSNFLIFMNRNSLVIFVNHSCSIYTCNQSLAQ